MAIPNLRASKCLLWATLACIAGAVHADPPPPHYCQIEMDFAVNGRPVASPSAIVEFGKAADVTVGNEAHAWRFRIVADAPTIIRRANVIPVSIEIYELVDGEPALRASPHFAVAPGQRADLDTMFGEDNGRRAHLALIANPRSEEDVEASRNSADK